MWSYEELTEGVIDRLGSTYSIEEITSGIDRSIKKGELIKPYDKNLNTLSTKENIKAEKRCIHLMKKLQNTLKPIINQKEIREQIRDRSLNIGQKDAVLIALNSQDRVVGIQGSAGTGKTTTLNAIKELASSKNYELIGLAPTRSAAATIRLPAADGPQKHPLFGSPSYFADLNWTVPRLPASVVPCVC